MLEHMKYAQPVTGPALLAAALSLRATHGVMFATHLLLEHGISLDVAVDLLVPGATVTELSRFWDEFAGSSVG